MQVLVEEAVSPEDIDVDEAENRVEEAEGRSPRSPKTPKIAIGCSRR